MNNTGVEKDKLVLDRSAIWVIVQNTLEQKIKMVVEAKVSHLCESGAINLDDYDVDSVADLLLTAALKDVVAKRVHIATPKIRKELKNLEKF